ncbi:hypothetical protein SAMN04488061_2281 [Filomicrobium insigne]|uniref:Uncharacterized protein n=1 Tax=Filomicrobium insigne TaxID=418854 RepID=A0A1H0Q9F8_9HYPH|nr:hypothetical protein [Filomicrobium insigne]SDP13319.1 hypothetical protein SAMN04488061_2281 [Filomicrobium insigne]
MGIKSLMSAAHAAGFAMASSEDLLKSSSKSLSEIGRDDEPQRPVYTYVPVLEREVAALPAPRSRAIYPIPAGRALVPVAPKATDTYERWRHYWLGWLSGRAVA